MDRREVIQMGGVAALAGVAGYAWPESDGTQLPELTVTHVKLANAVTEPTVFDLVVVSDDEIIEWSTHEVDAGAGDGDVFGSTEVDISAPDKPGPVTIHARVGDTWGRWAPDAEHLDGEAAFPVITYPLGGDELTIEWGGSLKLTRSGV